MKNVTVKELICKLLELPMDAKIGIASYDENEELWGESIIELHDKKDLDIRHGNKKLDYYLR